MRKSVSKIARMAGKRRWSSPKKPSDEGLHEFSKKTFPSKVVEKKNNTRRFAQKKRNLSSKKSLCVGKAQQKGKEARSTRKKFRRLKLVLQHAKETILKESARPDRKSAILNLRAISGEK